MDRIVKCPNCGKEANASGSVSCWCDRDFCEGQRCGADRLFAEYECPFCGSKGTPPETLAYQKAHLD